MPYSENLNHLLWRISYGEGLIMGKKYNLFRKYIHLVKIYKSIYIYITLIIAKLQAKSLFFNNIFNEKLNETLMQRRSY